VKIKLIDKKIFKNKYFWIVIFVLFLFLFINRSLFIFLIIVIAAAILNYFIHVTNIHVHLGHVAFLAIIFSYSLGFWYGVLTIILAHIFSEIMAGHADMEMVISAGVYVILCYVGASFNTVPIVRLGIILTIIQGVLKIILEKMAGTPMLELITENGVEFLMLLFYFFSFAKPLVRLLA
jgi:hypothetical protein